VANPSDADGEVSLPGFRLRMARTERGMTLEQIAAGSCISLRTLAALEADDYAKLPEAVYVRGYVRRYAALLGIAAQPLVDDLDVRYGAHRSESDGAVRHHRQARGLRRAWLLAGGAIVVLILGALLRVIFQ
jgi:cytoskeleton protein RodZ